MSYPVAISQRRNKRVTGRKAAMRILERIASGGRQPSAMLTHQARSLGYQHYSYPIAKTSYLLWHRIRLTTVQMTSQKSSRGTRPSNFFQQDLKMSST